MPANSAPPYALATSTGLKVMMRRRSDKSDERGMVGLFVAFVGIESEEGAIGMSRGSGRLQRRILEILEQAPERKRNREELDNVLVEIEGFDPSNVLRAIKGLARKHRVGFTDRAHKKDSVVSLPRQVGPITDDELSELLAEIGGRR
jgi:hypothetical protein